MEKELKISLSRKLFPFFSCLILKHLAPGAWKRTFLLVSLLAKGETRRSMFSRAFPAAPQYCDSDGKRDICNGHDPKYEDAGRIFCVPSAFILVTGLCDIIINLPFKTKLNHS